MFEDIILSYVSVKSMWEFSTNGFDFLAEIATLNQ